MQRGIINFTNEELKILYDYLKQNCYNPLVNIDKFQPVFEEDNSFIADKLIKIQTNKEEVEAILDALPAPALENNKNMTLISLRARFMERVG